MIEQMLEDHGFDPSDFTKEELETMTENDVREMIGFSDDYNEVRRYRPEV